MKSAALPVLVFCLFLLAPPPATADTCAACAGLDGFVPPDAIDADLYLMVGKARRSDKVRSVQIQEARGVVRTGLKPAFIEDGNCPGIDTEAWAIDYSAKRPWPALHKGVDIPRPRGTPIRAIADGMVIGIFENADNRKGIEIALRHTPEQTGLPFWTYSHCISPCCSAPCPPGAMTAGCSCPPTASSWTRSPSTGRRGLISRRSSPGCPHRTKPCRWPI